MRDLLCDDFQNAVRDSLIRHKSILDVLSKYQEAGARVNRAVLKAVTTCGCLRIKAEKPRFPPDITLEELREKMPTHLEGRLCDTCLEAVEEELGRHIFYLAALCNTLDLNLFDIIIKENKKVTTLGMFNIG